MDERRQRHGTTAVLKPIFWTIIIIIIIQTTTTTWAFVKAWRTAGYRLFGKNVWSTYHARVARSRENLQLWSWNLWVLCRPSPVKILFFLLPFLLLVWVSRARDSSWTPIRPWLFAIQHPLGRMGPCFALPRYLLLTDPIFLVAGLVWYIFSYRRCPMAPRWRLYT